MSDTRIGTLRDRVDVLSPIRTEDPASGEVLVGFQTTASRMPAKIRSSQTESERGGKLVSVTRHEVTIRYVQSLEGRTDWRLSIDGRQCDVTSSIDRDRRRRFLFVTAIATE